MTTASIFETLRDGIPYAGIGSQKTPGDILKYMESLARVLANQGAVLRSGGADGADTAFEKGAGDGRKEIYLPWPRFNGNPSPLHTYSDRHCQIARKFHPVWDKLSNGARKMMTRNTAQIFGMDFTILSAAVICWTPRATLTGGTSQAIRIALSENIPVINLADAKVLQEVSDFLDTKQ